MPNAPQPVKTKQPGIGLPIFLIVWPIALIPVLMILLFVVGTIFPDTPPAPGSEQLFDTPSAPKAIVNTIVFVGGAINVIAGLPSLIIGIVMLSKRRSR